MVGLWEMIPHWMQAVIGTGVFAFVVLMFAGAIFLVRDDGQTH